MKHRILIWALALILTVFISVPALAAYDDPVAFTDGDGNTITVEVGEHDSNTDSGVIILPGPNDGSQSGSTQSGNTQSGSGQTGTPSDGTQQSGTPSGNTDSAVIDLSQDPQDASDDAAGTDTQDDADSPAEEDGAAAAEQTGAKSGSDGKLPAGTAFTLMAILAVILIAGIVYLVKSRKKK